MHRAPLKPSKSLFIFGGLGLLSSPVCAQRFVQQTQVAPSASQTRAEVFAADVFAEDARLLQKAAVHVEGMPLDELLAQLSQQTGVTLKVQQDIADEKVIAVWQEVLSMATMCSE